LAVDEFLSVPSHVLLPEDVSQSTQYTRADEQRLDEEMEQLEARAKRVCGGTFQKQFLVRLFVHVMGKRCILKIFLF
jgi:hypothetical protein